MHKIIVNEDLSSYAVSEDGTKELFLASHNPFTTRPFNSAEEVEAFIVTHADAYDLWIPFIDPALREQERIEQLSKSVRSARNLLLSESDWVVTFHTEKGTNIPMEWEVYRQALRDLTSLPNFPELAEEDWPVKPA